MDTCVGGVGDNVNFVTFSPQIITLTKQCTQDQAVYENNVADGKRRKRNGKDGGQEQAGSGALLIGSREMTSSRSGSGQLQVQVGLDPHSMFQVQSRRHTKSPYSSSYYVSITCHRIVQIPINGASHSSARSVDGRCYGVPCAPRIQLLSTTNSTLPLI